MTHPVIPHVVEGVAIVPRPLPLIPEISLYLMTDEYPVDPLAQAEYQRLMQRPPYWAFCWGGGQALARWIIDNPQSIRARDVVDFGAGSGIAGIAAASAGAASVTAVDIDPDALQVCLANAGLNGVSVAVSQAFLPGSGQLLLAADVGYEEDGFAAVIAHIDRGGAALVAESRLRDLHQRFPALTLKSCCRVRTFPELDEAEMFDEVHIYATF